MERNKQNRVCFSSFHARLVELVLKIILMPLLMLRQKKKEIQILEMMTAQSSMWRIEVFPTPEHIEADGSDAFSAKYEKEKEVHIDVDDLPVEVDVSNAVSETRNKQIPHSKKHLNMKLFKNVEPEVINKMPWNPNGNKIYIINCKEEYWHKRQCDGKFWSFSPSSRKGFVGVRKFGKCLGSFICLNDECPAYTTEGICNEIDFKKESNGPHVCKSCSFFVQRKACEALKVTV